MNSEEKDKKESENFETYLGKEISEHLLSTASEILHQKSKVEPKESDEK